MNGVLNRNTGLQKFSFLVYLTYLQSLSLTSQRRPPHLPRELVQDVLFSIFAKISLRFLSLTEEEMSFSFFICTFS